MNKITLPFFADFISLFFNRSSDILVILACLGRNGLQSDCCSDAIIKSKTGLSEDTIQSIFKRLEEENSFVRDKTRKKIRYGRMDFNDNFKKNYKFIFERYSDIYSNSFKGVIKEINKTTSKIILEGENNHEYVALSLNNHSIVFCAPIGTIISFNGSLISQDINNTTIWMDERSVEYCEELVFLSEDLV